MSLHSKYQSIYRQLRVWQRDTCLVYCKIAIGKQECGFEVFQSEPRPFYEAKAADSAFVIVFIYHIYYKLPVYLRQQYICGVECFALLGRRFRQISVRQTAICQADIFYLQYKTPLRIGLARRLEQSAQYRHVRIASLVGNDIHLYTVECNALDLYFLFE